MSFLLNFPLFLIVLSLSSSVISSLLNGKAARAVTLTLTALSASVNLVIFNYVYTHGLSYFYMMGHFPHPWGNEICIGPTESLFSFFFSLILFLSVFGGVRQLNEKIAPGKLRYFYVMTDLIQAALLVLVYTNDLFTGYVFIEICTLSSCGILMIRENGKTILASVRYMIFSLIGSGLFLFGVIFLYQITGHLLMPELKETVATLFASGAYRTPLLTAMCFITIGLAIKSGLFPFHLWMADTYGAAIPASSAILSGLISKGYLFFLVKIIYDVFGTDVFYASGINNVLYVLGASGIVVGSISAIREDNLFRMIAYSSAAQIGYIYMGLGLSANLGIEAALFHILTHALTKPALFLASGQISDTMRGAKRFRNLQGAGYDNRPAALFFSFEAFSMIGLPLTMGFISKYLFGVAAFENAHMKMIPTLLVLAVSTVLNTMYFARTILRFFNKREPGMKLPEKPLKTTLKSQPQYLIAAVLFAAVNLVLGIFAKPFIDILAECLRIF